MEWFWISVCLERRGNSLGSQIIAIADAFDAIISDRIYRSSRSKKIGIEILLNEKWKQFNGDLVDIFVRQLNTDKLKDSLL